MFLLVISIFLIIFSFYLETQAAVIPLFLPLFPLLIRRGERKERKTSTPFTTLLFFLSLAKEKEREECGVTGVVILWNMKSKGNKRDVVRTSIS